MARKTTVTTKTNNQTTAVDADKKLSAPELNHLVTTVNDNFERLVLNWTLDVNANDVLPLNRVIEYNNVLYRVTTSYDVGPGKTFTRTNFIIVGESIELESVSVVAGSPNTVTFNMRNERQKRFIISSTISVNITLALSNASNFRLLTFDFDTNTSINITMPSTTIMVPSSGTAWTGGVLTVPSGRHSLMLYWDGTNYVGILILGLIT